MKMKIYVSLFLLFSMKSSAQNFPDTVFKVLVEKEQRLVDAIAAGDKPVWKSSLHDSCIITVENGSYMTKEKLIEDLNPLPAAYKGMIKITEAALRAYGNTVVLTFINDEYLELYGQKIHTRYRQTDTWIKINGEWKVIAMQVFEIPKNPPPVMLPGSVLLKYTGTYELSEDRKCIITVDKGKLYARKNGKEVVELFAETENVFFRQGDGRIRVLFIKEGSNNKYKMIERRAGEDVVWSQISK